MSGVSPEALEQTGHLPTEEVDASSPGLYNLGPEQLFEMRQAALEGAAKFLRGHQSDDGLKLSCDRKVSPRGIAQPSRQRWIPTVPDSFGLPAGESCPGKTLFCVDCYAVNAEQSKGVHDLVDHNFRLLRDAETEENMTELLFGMVATYWKEAEAQDLSERERIFRIHWDGDFFNKTYASAWANTIRAFPEINFFAYTRSIREPVNVVPILVDLENLSLYISVDEYNSDDALKVAEEYPGVLLARCAEDYASAISLAPDRPSLECPENKGTLPLMDNGVGACVRCMVCPSGKRDVLFSVTIPARPKKVKIELPSMRSGEVIGTCENPSCENEIVRTSTRGRPPKYCGTDCRWDVAHQKGNVARRAGRLAAAKQVLPYSGCSI